MLAAWVIVRGSEAGFATLWATIGVCLALAMSTLFSVGVVFLGLAGLVAADLVSVSATSGRDWYRPRYLGIQLLAFAGTVVVLTWPVLIER